MKKRIQLLLALLLLAGAGAGVLYAVILYTGGHSIPQKSDAILVLGCRVVGEKPSTSLEYRLEKALDLYQQGYGAKIIVSGGQGGNEGISEAAAMKKWLVEHQVDEQVILEEDQSTSTLENLKYSAAILEKEQLESAVIVTNSYHIFRSLFLAKRLGLHCSGAPAPDAFYGREYFRAREVISVMKSYLLDR